jgi:nicotinamide-nucleotide amidase
VSSTELDLRVVGDSFRIETLATGDEIVGGEVLDGNSAWFSRELMARGFRVARFNAIPDDPVALADEIEAVARRARLVVVSGGLGPTEDDLTVDVVARLLGTEAIEDPAAKARLLERFQALGRPVIERSLRSIRVPQGATVHANLEGSAPGFSIERQGCTIFFLPGVPREYQYLIRAAVLPWLAAHGPNPSVALKVLKVLGLPEALVEEKVGGVAAEVPGLVLGYRAHNPDVYLKLRAHGATVAEAEARAVTAAALAREKLDGRVYGEGDDELWTIVGPLLRDRGLKLATAESCTGGLIGSLLTSVPGSSDYYAGGFVTYTNELKVRLLGVPAALLEPSGAGAVSRECAQAMAEGALAATGAGIALSVTGIAGPGGATATKPVGLVYLGLARHGAPTVVLERRFRGDRDRVRRASAATALEMVRRALLELSPLTDGPG